MNGKVFVVTGITGGNGGAVSKELLRRGFSVIGVGRNVKKIQRFECWAKQMGLEQRLDVVRADLSYETDRQRIIRQVENLGCPIAGVFHLAGRALFGNPEAEKVTAFEQSDFYGPVALMKALLPFIAEQGIISVNTSGAARINASTYPHYCRVKQWMEEWCDEMRLDSMVQEHQISMTLILMGVIATQIWDVPDHGVQPWMSRAIKAFMPSAERCAPKIVADSFDRRMESHVGRLASVIAHSPAFVLRGMESLVDLTIKTTIDY
ncbi:MAG: hypothetical protein COU33_05430 [Candidatus Magasanikbacteria bacterium CG10_big_fil_rev_8_21_14_0_10_43_6]|uniref:Short-chain dehydrogenase n=1 Tax=Candidatus Magasanikbacteria bacterium CG10_big_fil_rev_8_21_14_0_10_43_6 TaxID=1974650 RepID=A0A2M6VZT1_9BACT|nr:MAG: hypothetical protein COU33_05430 [Candidatus Magasanikbacteria bacterium CG10_big_fil_rev_8_21_14_0_10_43_6]